MSLDVREITPAEHLSYVQGRDSVSFLQVPSWAAVKAEWGSLSIGWFSNDELVGAGLVLLRQVPRARHLALVPCLLQPSGGGGQVFVLGGIGHGGEQWE